MEGVFMDQSSMNPRSSLSDIHRGRMLHGFYSSLSPASTGQIFPNMHVVNGVGLFGSPPVPPLYSSLPSFAVAPPPSLQPPLLPLPFSKSVTLPSPTKRVTAVRSRQHKNKPRPSAGSRKEARSPGTGRSDPNPVEKSTIPLKLDDWEEVKEDEKLLGRSLYSISPPPSSLPLPKFALTRPKTATVSCNIEVAGIGSGGVGGEDAGATDDLHRLLRL